MMNFEVSDTFHDSVFDIHYSIEQQSHIGCEKF